MKPVASLIISVYNNIPFLKSTLDSLLYQTDKRFEVIVSEDAEHSSMKEFLSSYNCNEKMYHLSQPDEGWQKNKALNRASLFAHTDYLVFIDGDCVLHPRFMEFHIKMAAESVVLGGKRIKLDAISSEWILENTEKTPFFQKYLWNNYYTMKKQGSLFMEEGIFIDPNSVFGFVSKMRSMYQLKGCNMSFSKKALYDINGFDEDYINPAIGEDIDLVWRFENKGYYLKSVRNLAVQYHLYHKESWVDQHINEEMMNMKKKLGLFYCQNGIRKLV